MKKRIKHRNKIKRLRRAEDKITICNLHSCIRITAGDILYCEAYDTYSILHLKENEEILSTKPLAFWLRKLPLFFWHIHKHSSINSTRLKNLFSASALSFSATCALLLPAED